MPLPITCPSCQRRLILPEAHQEQLLQCPGCGNRFRQQDDIPYLEPALEEQLLAPPYLEPAGEAERSERVQSRMNPRPAGGVPEPLPAPMRNPRRAKPPRNKVLVMVAVTVSILLMSALIAASVMFTSEMEQHGRRAWEHNWDERWREGAEAKELERLLAGQDAQEKKDDIEARLAKADDPHGLFATLAEEYLEQQDGPGLAKLAEAMRKLDPRHAAADYYLSLARASWAGPAEEAGPLFKAALAKESDKKKHEEYALGFMQAMLKSGRAVEAYEAVPDSQAAFRFLAAGLKNTHRNEPLRRLLRAHGKNQPEDTLLPWYQGELHVQQGQYPLAEKAFAAGLLKKPDAKTLESFRASRVTARYHLGQAVSAHAEIGPKEETFEQLAGLCLEDDNLALLQILLDAQQPLTPKHPGVLRACYRLKIRQKQTAEGIALFKAALALQADEDEREGMVSEFLSDMEEAGKALEAYHAAPDAKEAFRHLANGLLQGNKGDDLRRLIAAHRARHPEDPLASYYLGKLHERGNDFNRAADAFREAWMKAPEDQRSAMRGQLVQGLYRAGQWLKAYQEIEPRNDTFEQLANLLANDKKWQDLGSLVKAHRVQGGDGPSLLFHEARVRVFSKDPASAAPLLRQAYEAETVPHVRIHYVSTFVLDMQELGKGIEGYRAAPDRLTAFRILAPDLVSRQKDRKLEQLLREHGADQASDPLYQLYQGELHLLRGEVLLADQRFSAGLGSPSSPHHWQFRQGLLRVRVKMGQAAAAYREFGEAAYTFQALAALCQQEKSAGQLKALVAAHRMADPDDPGLALADAEVKWLEQDYEGALRLLRAERAGAAGFAWKTDDYLVRCLVKLKRTNEAIQEAEAVVKKKYGNQVLLMLAHASGGDVKQTIAATDKFSPPPYLLGNCYRDADLGPILKSEPFKAFREKYPEPKHNPADDLD